jgi:NAD(P)-dependent dehydrogenase (short-subunit alcohol dehydrogenase family)
MMDSKMTYNFAGKVALVTGAGGEQGIGRAIATRLAREGADVVVTDYMANPRNSTSWAGLPDVVREIEELGGKALAILGDVSQAGDVEEMVRQTLRSFGQIDILVNNAGTAAGEDRVPLVELKEEEWDRVQRVNAKGTFLCCKTVARVMIKQGRGGKILNMSSLSGKFGFANFGAYCASKFAIRGLTQSLAKELGPHGIQVHALCPGMILTERYTDIAEATAPDGVSTADHLEEIKKRTLSGAPLRRIGTPRDVAQTAAYLVSSESDFLTGLSITIDGGVLMD